MLNEEALKVAHRKVEDVLVDFRDRRISMLGAANGLVIREGDGKTSDAIRLSTRDALRIGIKEYLEMEDKTVEEEFLPFTCTYCNRAPANYVVKARWRVGARWRVHVELICANCADDTREDIEQLGEMVRASIYRIKIFEEKGK